MTRFAALTLALVACAPDGTPQPSLESGCEVVDRTAIDDRSVPIGDFVPADVIASALGEFGGMLMRDGVELDALSLTLAGAGEPEWVEYAPEAGEDGVLIDVHCSAAMEMPVTLTLTSGTALAETLDANLVVHAADEVALYASTDGSTLSGDATPLTLDPAELDFLRFEVSLAQAGADWDGELGFAGQRTEGQGDDGTVSMTFDRWATFTATR